MAAEDEDRVLEVLADLPEALELWMEEGMESAMNRINR